MGCITSAPQPESILFTPTANVVAAEDGTLVAVNDYVLIAGAAQRGRVFPVTHRKRKKVYAMKVIEKAMRRANEMNSEVLILMQLRHQNITNLHEVIEDVNDPGSRLFLCFEYVSGGPIMAIDEHGRADPNTRLSEAQTRHVAEQIVEGLMYLHKHNVIHRDIHPNNILIGDDQVVKICDFDVSQMLTSEEDFTQTSQGTLMFLPPEACRDHVPFSGKFADVWALGVTLFFYVFGHTPFSATTQSELANAIQNKELEFTSDVPISSNLKNLLSRMLRKQIRRRLDLNQIRDHPWLRRQNPTMPSLGSTDSSLTIQPVRIPALRRNRSILIVDDVYLLRRNTEHLVRDVIHVDSRCPVLIECAETGAAALQMCQQGLYDFILLDFHLDDPALDGCEIASRIRQMEKLVERQGIKRQPTIIIGLTGNDNAEIHEQLKHAGMDSVEQKPMHPYTLMKHLADAGFTITEKARSNIQRPAPRRDDPLLLESCDDGGEQLSARTDFCSPLGGTPTRPLWQSCNRPMLLAITQDPMAADLLRSFLRHPGGHPDQELEHRSPQELLRLVEEQLSAYEQHHRGLHPAHPPPPTELLFCTMAREMLRLQPEGPVPISPDRPLHPGSFTRI